MTCPASNSSSAGTRHVERGRVIELADIDRRHQRPRQSGEVSNFSAWPLRHPAARPWAETATTRRSVSAASISSRYDRHPSPEVSTWNQICLGDHDDCRDVSFPKDSELIERRGIDRFNRRDDHQRHGQLAGSLVHSRRSAPAVVDGDGGKADLDTVANRVESPDERRFPVVVLPEGSQEWRSKRQHVDLRCPRCHEDRGYRVVRVRPGEPPELTRCRQRR